MGIPVFREPVSAVDAKCKHRADACTTARSTIRRSRSVRYPRVRDTPSSAPRYPPPLASDIFGLSQTQRRSHRHNGTTQSRMDRPLQFTRLAQVEADADHVRREASDRRRIENGRPLLRDALSYERPGQLIARGPGATAPTETWSRSTSPAPANGALDSGRSWDRFMEENRRIEAAAQRNYAPTPPPYRAIDGPLPNPANQSPAPLQEPASTSTQASPSVGSASYTRRFAPAYRFTDPITDPATRLRSNPNRIHRHNHHHHRRPHPSLPRHSLQPYTTAASNLNPTNANLQVSTTNPTSNTGDIPVDITELPPLRRMGHRSILTELNNASRVRATNPGSGIIPARRHLTSSVSTAPARPVARAIVDGLGDRQRSPTPSDYWDTLQTTITPDARLPSASSSFASATASASASARESTSTSLTTPSDPDRDGSLPASASDHPPICDSDTSSVCSHPDHDHDHDHDHSSLLSSDEDDDEDDDLTIGSSLLDHPSPTTSEDSLLAAAVDNRATPRPGSTTDELMARIRSFRPQPQSARGTYNLAGFLAPGEPPSAEDRGRLEAELHRREAYSRELEEARRLLVGLVGREDLGDEWFEEVGLVRRRDGSRARADGGSGPQVL